MSLSTPKKALGQNFLVNSGIVDKLSTSAQVLSTDIVLEVGPGTGVVTKELAKHAKHVYSVDLDKSILEVAREQLASFRNVTFIQHDILTFDVSQVPLPYKVVGAIPYNITSPIIHKFLYEEHAPRSLTFIIQKEVAQKVTAQPPHASYLSMFVAYNGNATTVVPTIKPGSFNPPPKVDSSLIHIALNQDRDAADVCAFSEFLHKGFQHPRKMIKTVFDDSFLEKAGVSLKQRPSELTLDQWVCLFESMRK